MKAFLLILIASSVASGYLVVTTPTETFNYTTVPLTFDGNGEIMKGLQSFSGEFVTMSNRDVKGRIVITTRLRIGDVVGTIRNYQSRLAAAVVLVNTRPEDPGWDELQTDGNPTLDIKIPVASLRNDLGVALIQKINTSVVTAQVSFGEVNPWAIQATSGLWLAAQIIVCTLLGAGVAISIWKLVLFIRQSRLSSVASISLVVGLVAQLLYLSWWLVDPAWTRKMIPNESNIVMFSFGIYITITEGCIVTFYWHELLTISSIKPSASISKLRIPFLAAALALLLIDVAQTIAKMVVGVPAALVYIQTALMVAIALGISLYYFIMGGKVISKIKKMKGVKGSRIKRATFFLVLTGVSYICLMVIFLVYAVAGITYQLYYMRAYYFSHTFLGGVITLALGLSFIPAKPRMMSSTLSTQHSS